MFLLTSQFAANAQQSGGVRQKKIVIDSDTLLLDTLSIIPGSVKIFLPEGKNVDSAYYKINHATGKIIVDRKKLSAHGISVDYFNINYKTFPYLFSEEIKHKDIKKINADLSAEKNPFTYKIENTNDDIFKTSGLNKTGSISRGLNFGNNQDVVVNSNLNLQLSGKISDDVDILMVATDNTVPVQADGNTQQLQEFDRVFIQLTNKNNKLIAGDFQMRKPESYFMNFYKKAQGINFSTALNTNETKTDSIKKGVYKTNISAAVSRGKFSRNVVQGIEGNQGPYRLRGAENELFIIVLSGTESVYIDGKLLDRGQENDYVIDYNTAEIIFTAKQLITKDKRIVVEFQYSDRNYARSLVHFGNDYETKKYKVHFNLYSEQDHKNQPLQQDLTPEQKLLLGQVGDTLSLAVAPSFDSVAYNNSEVLYHKIDTVVGTYNYSDIFVFRLNSDTANYRVTFSNVGEGNGNYRQINSSANGKVFQWISPDTINNLKRGNFEPVIQLISPKKKQMLTAGAEYLITKNSKLSVEAAVSNNDINTFSSADSKDDVGYGIKINYDNIIKLKEKRNDSLKKNTFLVTNLNYEYVQENFSLIERFRAVEFERDWNRTSPLIISDQHIAGAAIGVKKKDVGFINYRFNAFLEGTNYNASKHFTSINFSKKGFNIIYDGSVLAADSKTKSNFYRHKSQLFQQTKWFTAGFRDEFENNRFALNKKDSLLSNSYQFWEWRAYLQNADSSINKYGIFYNQRTDYAAKAVSQASLLNKSAYAENYGAYFELLKDPNKQFKINTTYRRLTIVDSTLTLQKPDNSIVSRVEYNIRLLKGVIFSNSFYEIGSGLEVKKEFSFIEVAPGQGVYAWIDYNSNNIKELNEFEISAFPDQAKYIKVFTPTNDYIKTFSNQFSEVLMIKPAVLWANKKGFKKFIARFANQTAYRVERKTTQSDYAIAYNPFLNETKDSSLVALNSSFRNTFFINQMSPILGIDITYQDVRNKILLVNGIDSRKNIFKEARLRWNIGQKFSFNASYKDGTKSNASQFFTSRDYSINYFEIEPKFNFQPNTTFRLTLLFKHTEKKNKNELGGQIAQLQNYGVEVKYNVLQKGSLNANFNFIKIKFTGQQNSALAFEMLDALKTGQNYTWNITYQRNISNNLQLNLTYDGRKSEGVKIIHVGGAQVRAYF